MINLKSETMRYASSGRFARMAVALGAFALSASIVCAQGFYDDDLYYDASKAKKEAAKVEKNKPAAPAATQKTHSSAAPGMYYFDGANYVPWNNVGDYQSADSYAVQGQGLNRDVDEYNRRGNYSATASEKPDSITLQQFEQMSATEALARFNDSDVARQAIGYDQLGSANAGDLYASGYTDGYSNGYDQGYNNSANNLTISIGNYPYGFYNSYYYNYYGYWNYPYYSWRFPSWAWDPFYGYPSWGWGYPSWGLGYPSYAWGWGYPGYYPGYYPSFGWGSHWHNSPSAAHRPRGTSYRPNGGRYHYGNSSSSRPGYREPIGVSSRPSNGSTIGRNSHFGNSGNYRTGGSTRSSYGTSRPSGSGSNRGSFGSGQSTRNSGSFSSGSSHRSSGGFSSGSSGRSSSGGSRSGGGGGGHRSR